MPANVDSLNAAVQAAVDEATQTETVDASVVSILQNFSAATAKAVSDALAVDNAADQGSIDAASQAIANVTARFVAARTALGNAAVAGTPNENPTS